MSKIYNTPNSIFLKFFEDGVVIYNDTNGDTHKVDFHTGVIVDALKKTSLTSQDIFLQFPSIENNTIGYINETLSLLLSNNIIALTD